MAAVSTAVAVAGLALTAFSTISGYMAQRDAMKIQGQMAGMQMRQNELANQRANLEASRRRRQLIRQTMVERSDALSAAASQGALGGSGIAGGLAQVGAAGLSNIQGVNYGQQFGNQSYAIGQQQTALGAQYAAAASHANTMAGLGSLGGALVRNSGTIGQIAGVGFGGGNSSNSALNLYTGPTNSFA